MELNKLDGRNYLSLIYKINPYDYLSIILPHARSGIFNLFR